MLEKYVHLQVNKRVSFWLSWFSLFLPLFFWICVLQETIRNGGLYCVSLTAGERRCTRFPPVYEHSLERTGAARNVRQILKTIIYGLGQQYIPSGLYLALFWASVAGGVLAFLIFRFLRRLRKTGAG